MLRGPRSRGSAKVLLRCQSGDDSRSSSVDGFLPSNSTTAIAIGLQILTRWIYHLDQ
jgi:hypothetical protein